MAISIEKVLKLTQFQTGLQSAKNYTDGKVTELNAEIAKKALQTDLTTLSGKVTTLIGSDASKSVRKIANEELAAQLIPENAKETLDTLAEIAAWIQDHPDDASAMNAAIEALKTKLLGFETGESDGKVKQYIDAQILAAGIRLTDISAEVTGTGNAITSASYDSATGKFTFTKGATYLKESDIAITVATDSEVTAVCEAVFGA